MAGILGTHEKLMMMIIMSALKIITKKRPSPLLGIDAVIGLGYRFYKYPVTTGMEFKPFAEHGCYRIFRLDLWDFGFTVKFGKF
jgi:hypothetical protein